MTAAMLALCVMSALCQQTQDVLTWVVRHSSTMRFNGNLGGGRAQALIDRPKRTRTNQESMIRKHRPPVLPLAIGAFQLVEVASVSPLAAMEATLTTPDILIRKRSSNRPSWLIQQLHDGDATGDHRRTYISRDSGPDDVSGVLSE